jgi:hypothetical protein
MDASEPPRIVFDTGTVCSDRDGAEEALLHALDRARAPKAGWLVRTRIAATTTAELNAETDVIDDGGATVAHHASSAAGADCAGIARAEGEWAAGALDAELQRAAPQLAPLPEPPAPTPPSPPPPPVVPNAAPVAPPALTRPPSPMEAVDAPVETNEEPKWELGVGTFLLAGGGPGGDVGVSPFLIGKIGPDVFLRPSIAVGKPFLGSGSSTWAAARLDTCERLTGNYTPGQGMQLDLCGGVDAGFSHIASGDQAGFPVSAITQPYVDIGPSVDMRAEIGRMRISLRGLAGFNVAQQSFEDATGARVDPEILSLRIELDFSWKLDGDRPVVSSRGSVTPL